MINPDLLLEKWMEALLVFHQKKLQLGLPVIRWKKGEKLKLLLAGYNGTRNTGADVRVEEMIRQIRHVLGDEHVELTALTMDYEKTKGYFERALQLKLPEIFPSFLHRQCPKFHGVVACEGSMFKSKFANALSTMMAGALGMANVEGKLSVGYGAEVGHMTQDLEDLVRKSCGESLVICRNEPSRRMLDNLGIRHKGGTDTAWTFAPTPLDRGKKMLMDQGWDGEQEILFVCPINPFWWPVKPSLSKFFSHALLGRHQDTHYKSIYFHEYDESKRRNYDAYLSALTHAIETFRTKKNVFVALVAMEALDQTACVDLNQKLQAKAPLFLSADVNMYDMVSVLRNGSYMISSRFHAVVTSMPGLVAPIGVTMDERIRNVMTDAGLKDLVFEVDEVDLASKLEYAVSRVVEEKDRIRRDISTFIPKQLELMGNMGKDFLDEVCRVYPEFPRNPKLATWKDYLPPLSPEVAKLMQRG